MDGADAVDAVDGPNVSQMPVSVPTEADFLYAYSTVPGYYAWRNSKNGSWFIQSVAEVFEKYADHMDILHMLTRVNAAVAKKKSDTWPNLKSHEKMQIPSIVSMLRKDLFFFPK